MSMTFRDGPQPKNAASAEHYEAITPSDSVDLPHLTRGIYVGGDGDVVAVRADGVAVTLTGALAGTVLPVVARRVNSTNTTATSLVALY